MQFNETVNEYYGREDANEDPASHHPDRRSVCRSAKIGDVNRRFPCRGLDFGKSRHRRNSSRRFIDLSERLLALAGVSRLVNKNADCARTISKDSGRVAGTLTDSS